MLPVEAGLQRLLAAIVDLKRRTAMQKCLALNEECPAPVIRAHSIQGSSILNLLAHEGKVYMFRQRPDGFHLELDGQNRVTTFTGFCQPHDSELFREIDFDMTRAFNPASKRQLCLLSLRAVAREYWLKLNNSKMCQRLMGLAARRDLEALRSILNLSLSDEEFNVTYFGEHMKLFFLGTKRSTSRIQRLYRSLYC